MKCKIIGCGSYLPKRVVTNDELSKSIDTNDEWIRSRTGITQRHIAAEDEYTSDLALQASQNAILDAGISATDIDLIINCTTTPDNSFPSVATKLQASLGVGNNVPAFDTQAVCSGFIYGLHIADALMNSGKYNTILLVGSEKMSSLLDWQDRSTCVLFGDGAGAVILKCIEDESGVIDSKIYSDGAYYDLLHTDGGVSMNRISGKIIMKGTELFRHATDKMAQSVEEILRVNNVQMDDITYLIPHQANIRIIEKLAESLNIAGKKIVKTIQKHANCSAASIPLALNELKSSGDLKKNDLILFTAIGGGLTWGSALLRW